MKQVCVCKDEGPTNHKEQGSTKWCWAAPFAYVILLVDYQGTRGFLTPIIDNNNNKIYQPDCEQPCDRSMCQMFMICLMLEALLRYYITFMKLQITKNDHLGAPIVSASFKFVTKKKS